MKEYVLTQNLAKDNSSHFVVFPNTWPNLSQSPQKKVFIKSYMNLKVKNTKTGFSLHFSEVTNESEGKG